MKDCEAHIMDFELIKIRKLVNVQSREITGEKPWPWNQIGNSIKLILRRDLYKEKTKIKSCIYVLGQNTTLKYQVGKAKLVNNSNIYFLNQY